MPTPSPGIRPLLDREAYHLACEREWERTRARSVIAFGVFFGTSMWAIGMLVVAVTGGLTWHDVQVMGVLCAVGGMLCAAALDEWTLPPIREKERRFIDRVYDGDPALVAPPPDAAEYPVSLPSAVLIAPRVFLGGVLYVGPGGMLFLPHLIHPPHLRDALRIGPAAAITMKPMQLPRRLLDLLLGRRFDVLLVQWEGGLALFTASEPSETQRSIERVLRRFGPG